MTIAKSVHKHGSCSRAAVRRPFVAIGLKRHIDTVVGGIRPFGVRPIRQLRRQHHPLDRWWLLPSPATERKKKADVAEHPGVFDHVGLLVNEPPGTAGLLFI